MFALFNDLVLAGGISGLTQDIVQNWIGPLFLAAVAVFAIIFIKDRSWMKLIGFVGIAAVVGMLIYSSDTLFSKDGALTKTSTDVAKQVKY
jgi:uncharacterized MAPEG superfamily protein